MHAFLNCPNLTFVKIYEGVENTAANAFCGTHFAFTTFLDSGRAISGFSVKSSRSGRRGFPQANVRFPVVLSSSMTLERQHTWVLETHSSQQSFSRSLRSGTSGRWLRIFRKITTWGREGAFVMTKLLGFDRSTR